VSTTARFTLRVPSSASAEVAGSSAAMLVGCRLRILLAALDKRLHCPNGKPLNIFTEDANAGGGLDDVKEMFAEMKRIVG